jgi:hypothetical protein
MYDPRRLPNLDGSEYRAQQVVEQVELSTPFEGGLSSSVRRNFTSFLQVTA